MSFQLEDRWIWDFWIARDDGVYHLFYLQASRSLGDPDLRHVNATIGHATSTDLITWTDEGTVIKPGLPGEWDDVATWTGSVIRHAGKWWMFYTGTTDAEGGLIQRIGAAVSDDLFFWIKHPSNPLIQAHPFWYEQLEPEVWHDEAWRDPWVYSVDDGFEMLVTARVKAGPGADRGVIGRAFSADLTVWTAIPPLTSPGGFGQMEVSQLVEVEGRKYVLFSCLPTELAPERAATEPQSGCYLLAIDGSRPPIPASEAKTLELPNMYAPRVVQDPSGAWVVLGFELETDDGEFSGRILDPVPLAPLLAG